VPKCIFCGEIVDTLSKCDICGEEFCVECGKLTSKTCFLCLEEAEEDDVW
jgi:hypothetical protein